VNLLFRRELRRLAPYGLGLLVGYLVLGNWILLSQTHSSASEGVFLLLLAIPALLGIATVAPDTSSGGTAFLARLPLSTTRVFLIKVAAASAWLVVSAGLSTFHWLVASGERPGADWLAVVLGGGLALAFTSALVASVVARTTLHAVMAAPMVAGAAFGLASGYVGIVLEAGFGSRTDGFVALALAACFLPCAYLSYTQGERHRTSSRPAILGLGGVTMSVAGLLVAATVAQAWVRDAVLPQLAVVSFGPHPATRRFVVLDLAGSTAFGPEARVATVDRASGDAWVVPLRNPSVVGSSPDGRFLLGSWTPLGRGRLHLADAERRSLVPLPGRWTLELPVFAVFREGTPLLLRQRGAVLEVADATVGELPAVSRKLEPETRLVGARPEGSAILVRREVVLVAPVSNVEIGEPKPVATLPAACSEALLSSSGRLLLTRSAADAASLAIVDLDTGSVRRLDAKLAGGQAARLPALGVAASFSPDGATLALALDDAACAFFATATGDLLRVRKRAGEYPRVAPVVWSDDGKLAALPWHEVLDVERGSVTSREVAAFLHDGRFVRDERPLEIVSLANDDVMARPLETR
jgi:hypothetical protein